MIISRVLSSVFLWMCRMSAFFNDRIESVMIISGVMDGTESAVRISYGIVSLDYVAVTFLMMSFVVTGVWVSDTIFVLVLGMRVVVDVVVRMTSTRITCISISGTTVTSMGKNWGRIAGHSWR